MNSEYKHSYVYIDDVKTHYIEAGEGAPLILVHGRGAGSSGEANYGDVIGPLGENFHAIAPDIIGYGYTAPRGLQDMSGEAEGKFLIRFIETLDVGPVFLGGNSHGGFLAQYAAHERPDLVKRLIIINSMNGTSPYPPLPEGRKYIYGPGGHQAREPNLEDMLARLKNGGRSFFAHRDLNTEDRVRRSYEIILRNYKHADERGRANSSTTEDAIRDLSYKGKHISELASELKMPVLLTWSEPGSKIEWGLSHFNKISGAEMHLFPWSGHHVQTDQRDRWVQVVTNWLQNEPARPHNDPQPERRSSPGVRRFMTYVTDEIYEALENEAENQSMSIQRFVQVTLEEHLGKKSDVKIFHNDGLCPNCLSYGELVENYEGKVHCLNCGYKRQ
jgi:pimeloyl-ACP methyl ester carboxylesterase